jgi:hypothetical protein
LCKGLVTALAGAAGLTGTLALGIWLGLSPPPPSSQLLEGLGQAGIGLLIAYSVAIAIGQRVLSDRSTRSSHEVWLGFAIGLGISALIGIGLAFGLAGHRRAGHANWIDWLGFCWTVASIGLLGVLVALQPFLDYEWRRLPQRHRWRTERLRRGTRQQRRGRELSA